VTNKKSTAKKFPFSIKNFKNIKTRKKLQKPKTSQIDFLFASPNERKG